MISNPFHPRDMVMLKNDDRKAPEGLRRGHVYTVQNVVSDRVQIKGCLYFASRFEQYTIAEAPTSKSGVSSPVDREFPNGEGWYR